MVSFINSGQLKHYQMYNLFKFAVSFTDCGETVELHNEFADVMRRLKAIENEIQKMTVHKKEEHC